MTGYKFLAAGSVGRFSDFTWPVPQGEAPGEWVEGGAPLTDCLRGVHACRVDQLLDWIDDELWEIELDGECTDRDSMLIAERGRLTRRVASWDEDTARALGDACAWRSRGFALDALRQIGLTSEAEQLLETISLTDMQATAAAAVRTQGDSAATEVVAFAADAVSLVGGRRPDAWRDAHASFSTIVQTPAATAANLAFVVAHGAGRAAASGGDEDAYATGFAAERAWQLTWLRERLGL